MTEYIVRLEDGVWLDDGPGDPPRTTQRERAKRFVNYEDADIAIESARQYRPFRWSAVEDADGPAIQAARAATETLIAAMRILSTDGIANAAVAEAAERLAELQEAERKLADLLEAAEQLYHHLDENTDQPARLIPVELVEAVRLAIAEAERNSAITLASLRELSRQWKEREASQTWGSTTPRSAFIRELDEILEET